MTRKPVFPFVERSLTTFVELNAFYLNKDIGVHVLEKLRDKEEGKCNEYGYVAHVISVQSISPCEIRPEDLSANTTFKVKFVCILCRPQCTPEKKDVVIVKIRQLNNSLIICENGPMRAIIQTNQVDTQVFDVSGDSIVHRLTSKRLEPETFIRMQILQIKFHVHDTNIKMIGSLVDIAHTGDEEAYFYDEANDHQFTYLKNKMSQRGTKN